MTPMEWLAYIVAGFLMLLTSIYFGWLMRTRSKALKARQELQRLALEKQSRFQEKALGAVGEGMGWIPGDQEEAAKEEMARLRAQGKR